MTDSNFQDDIEKYIQREEINSYYTFILNELPIRERIIFFHRLGRKEQKFIAGKLKLSQSYISRLEKKINKKVQRSSIKQPLFNNRINDIYFQILENKMFFIGFLMAKFPNFNKVISNLLNENKNFSYLLSIQNQNEYFMIKMLVEDDSFVFVAELLQNLYKYNVS